MRTRKTHPVLLLLILLVHLMALWMLARQQRFVKLPPAPQERITYLVTVPPPVVKPPPPVVVPKKTTAPPPAAQRRAAVQATTAPTAAPVVMAAEPAPAPDPEPAHHLSTAEILEQAHRDMPRLERELRNGVPTKLKLDPNSVRAKLEQGIADAYVGGDQRVTVDFYTSPDNVHYMRMTRNGKSWCTMNGGGPVTLARANGVGVDRDTKVNCPPASPSEWKDMPYLN